MRPYPDDTPGAAAYIVLAGMALVPLLLAMAVGALLRGKRDKGCGDRP